MFAQAITGKGIAQKANQAERTEATQLTQSYIQLLKFIQVIYDHTYSHYFVLQRQICTALVMQCGEDMNC